MEKGKVKKVILGYVMIGIVFLLIMLVFFSGGDSTNDIKYNREGYLKNPANNRIHIYTYTGNPTCNDIKEHGKNTRNTQGQTTWNYYFKNGVENPGNQISNIDDFAKGQSILEKFTGKYNFTHVIAYSGEHLTKKYGDSNEGQECK